SKGDARTAPEPDRRTRADGRRSSRLLSGCLLVFDAADSGKERVSRHGLERERNPACDEGSALLDRYAQELVSIVSRARLQGYSHLPTRMGTFRKINSGVDPGLDT